MAQRMAGEKKNSKRGTKQKKKSSKRRAKGRKDHDVDDAVPPIEDERFAAASNRPQFHSSSKSSDKSVSSGLLVGSGRGGGGGSSGKVAIDERFAAALTDPRFRIGGDTGDVDKYGRSKKKKKKDGKRTNEELERFYTVTKKKESPKDEVGTGTPGEEGSDSSSGDERFESRAGRKDERRGTGDSDDSSSSESDEGGGSDDNGEGDDVIGGMQEEEVEDDAADDANDPASRMAYLTALSRGEIEASSSSSDSSTDDDDASAASFSDSVAESDSEEDSLGGRAGVLDPSTRQAEEDDIEITDEPSPYLAVCNMDWSAVRAVDILAILSSFSPPGSVRRVRVYPSDFGIERMKKEEVMGPEGIWTRTKTEGDKSGGSDEEGSSDDADIDGDGINSDAEVDNSDEEGGGSSADDADDAYDHFPSNPIADIPADSDFDPEKLRAYEASKLKYYFAVAEFTSPEAADAAYREVDGMEVGHSSAMIDLRSIPPSGIDAVVKDREVRDGCDAVPSNYEPPDFVVTALQQTAVRCTWEDGDDDRERKLTQYGVGSEAWAAMAEGDDLKAYLASEGSSDEEDSDVDGNDDDVAARGKKNKGAKMRALLGLDSDHDDEGKDGNSGGGSDAESSTTESDGVEDERDEENEGEAGDIVKEVTFIPGKKGLEDKIRTNLESKKAAAGGEAKELTPWEKYQLKRKEKRKERRKAIRSRRKDKLNDETGTPDDDDGMYAEDPEFGVPDSDGEGTGGGGDDFFLGEGTTPKKKRKDRRGKDAGRDMGDDGGRVPSTKEELELLIAGDKDEEDEKDFDMRGIVRMEKVKGKKLRGSRKRKEAYLAADVSGTDFRIDTTDNRFAAVLEGSDERFGIDRTDPSYKDTPAMQAVLAEQSKRRKAKKRAKVADAPDVSADAVNETDAPSGGALALSSLVKSLKTKVAKQKEQ